MSEQQLRYMINQVAPVAFMDFPLKPDGMPVGYAYVKFDGYNALSNAQNVIGKYDAYFVDGCKLEVGLY